MPARTKRTAARTKRSWQDTWLWETLEKRARAPGNDHAREFLPNLTLWMGKLDTVLQKAGTAQLDFTLHDADHALRVADRMEQLLTTTTRRNLSDYELALLLLAAYGHDIGMSPERKKVSQHHRHLFGHDTGLTDEEKFRYQEFLDNYADQPVTLPLTNGLADLNLADELTAYYVRDRHNDWSGEWLRASLTGDFAFLPQVAETLIRLCASHHWGFDKLSAIEFQPFLSTGPHPQLIHLRYLACLLRLADILENDPERTPEVIMRHRSIDERGRSLVHWQKDHSLSIDLRGDRLHFQARPRSAVAHKALLQLADWIDHELQGIAAFGSNLPPEWPVGGRTIERAWHLAPAATRDIQPVPSTYEYIEGAFRPNTSRLLQLLSNEQLYGRPIVAVRELLQNAFDAVREKIARLRLASHITDPADSKWEQLLGDQEKVTLTLRPDKQGHWHLICEDTGVGLTKALITGHLLVSGQNRRHAILELERQCEKKGFRPGLTGQFGIGVLSYFMLAEELTLETNRHQGCQDLDGIGWHFTTRGVGSFGELRKLETSPFPTGGSRIDWRLREDRIEAPAAFAADLFKYLKDTLIRLPCRFEFKTESVPDGDHLWQRPTGWVKTAEDWIQAGMSEWKEPEEFYRSKDDYLPAAERQKWDDRKASYPADLAAARASLRCEFLEVPLPGEAGTGRLVLRYFELEEGRSLQFPGEKLRDETFKIEIVGIGSWKGIACQMNMAGPNDRKHGIRTKVNLQLPCIAVELDLTSSAPSLLSVNRQEALFTDKIFEDWCAHLLPASAPWTETILAGGRGHYYQEVNLFNMLNPLTLEEGRGWHHADKGEAFRPLKRPFALMSDGFGWQTGFKGAQDPTPIGQLDSATWNGGLLPGFRLMALQVMWNHGPLLYPTAYWASGGGTIPSGTMQPPPGWEAIAMVLTADRAGIFHVAHPLVSLLSDSLARARFDDCHHHVPVCRDLDAAATPVAAARALLRAAGHALVSYSDGHVQTYREQRGEHWLQLWEMVATASGQPLSGLRVFALHRHWAVLISAEECRHGEMFASRKPLLPEVTDPVWLLYGADREK